MRVAIAVFLVLCITLALFNDASAWRRRWPSRRWHERHGERYYPRDEGLDPHDEDYDHPEEERDPSDDMRGPSDEVREPSNESREPSNGSQDPSDEKCERRRRPIRVRGYLLRCWYRCRRPRFSGNEEDGSPCLMHYWRRGVCYDGICVNRVPDVTTEEPQTTTLGPGPCVTTEEPQTTTQGPKPDVTTEEPETTTRGPRPTPTSATQPVQTTASEPDVVTGGYGTTTSGP